MSKTNFTRTGEYCDTCGEPLYSDTKHQCPLYVGIGKLAAAFERIAAALEKLTGEQPNDKTN